MHITFTPPVPWFSTPFSVSLRPPWAYGFDTAARRALEKSKVSEKEKTFLLQPNLLFKKQIAECHQDWREPP